MGFEWESQHGKPNFSLEHLGVNRLTLRNDPFFGDPLKPRFIDSDSFIFEDYSEMLMLDKTRIYDEI